VRLTDRLSQPQKIVIVLALGMAFGAAGTYLFGFGSTSAGGWYAYAPLSQTPFTGTGMFAAARPHGWPRLLIWLALIGLWALLSVRVLRPSPEQAPHD
jgi:heme/copper-type cytochrome/quinol oxidase subunit 1